MAFENFNYETITEVAIKSTIFFGIGAVIVLAASGGEFEQSDFKWLVIGGAGLLISLLLYFIRFFLDRGWIARLIISGILAGVISFSYLGLQDYSTEADTKEAEYLGLEWMVDPRSKIHNPFRYRNMSVKDIEVSTDGNVFFAATLRVGHGDDYRMILGKISGEGKILWKKRLKTLESSLPSDVFPVGLNAVEALPDGGALVAGKNGFFARVDKDGKTIWRKKHGMSQFTDINDIMLIEDGKVFIVGTGGGDGCYGCDKSYIALLTAEGNVVWEKQMDTDGENYFASLVKSSDGSILAIGSVDHPEKGSQGRVVKISFSGENLTELTFDKLDYRATIASFASAGGTSLIATTIRSNNRGSKSDMALYTLNNDMTKFRLQRYFGPITGSNEIYAVNQMENGDVVIAGSSAQKSEGDSEGTAIIFNTNTERSDSWSNKITSKWGSRVNDIVILSDGSQVFSLSSFDTRIARRQPYTDSSPAEIISEADR